ncbi:hypothetical protein D0Z07_4351 [Hyphodiscus hymeniophilus]|uniref:F-box domain-containing protein n=1 Tax=Hyphodiscus hymeniophilus TaxID=353542 RepID=A0A9P6VJ46_9HELO|nr:hypothetical protein D0Z07_4351 [Hyphodiscus hymeniophilus]
MDTLPTELRQQILIHCPTPTLQSLRLTSKLWASLGFEYLISTTFTSLPHRPSFAHLLAISRTSLSQKLKSLFLNLGELNEYHARHNSYFLQYMRDPDERLAAQESSWGSYAWFRDEKERYMPLACASELLNPALKNIPSLRRVEVSLTTCPFPEIEETELLRQIWQIPSTRLLPRVATTERFTNLCLAIAGSPSRVEELSHDRLPLEFFAQKAITVSLISTVFLSLTRLSLVLDYSDMPNNLHSSQAFQNLSHCLRSASNMESLSLSFQGRQKTDITPFFASLAERDHVFEKLSDVKFEGVRCNEKDLVDFLSRNKRSLKNVQLGGPGLKAPHQKANGGLTLSEGSWKSVFEKVLAGLALQPKHFLIQGDMMQTDGRMFLVEDLAAAEDLGSLVK